MKDDGVMKEVRQVQPLDPETARMIRRLDFIEREAEIARRYFEALEAEPIHEATLSRLPQLPELLDGYLKLMFEEAYGIRADLAHADVGGSSEIIFAK